MSEFIQIHMLTSYAPSNLNRDDLGRPKTARMGGVDRLRISSQSLKRAWRTSDLFQNKMSGHIGTRTKRLGVEVFERFKQAGVEDKDAGSWAKTIASQFAKLAAEDEKAPLAQFMTKQLIHVSREEKERVTALADTLAKEKRSPQKEELAFLRKDSQAVDIALFGRMLAEKTAFNIEAAAQVSHAITVNRIVVEDDYFTAVDDLNKHEEDAGSAHIDQASFGSGVFYIYICINKSLLVENLSDASLASRAIKALVEAAAQVAPTGKQNSFASRARALYILAERGTQQPRQLSAAFLKPVDDEDMAAAAVTRLETLRANMDKVYGKCYDDEYPVNVLMGEGRFDDLLKFVAK